LKKKLAKKIDKKGRDKCENFMGQTSTKCSSLYLPAQSGKTAKMKERIIQLSGVHIIISSNNKSLVEQTSYRMGPDTLIWHSGRTKTDIYQEIMQGVTNIVCCANRTRFDALETLLDKLEKEEEFLKKIYIWMDEGDAYIGLWKRKLEKLNEWSKLESVVIISATQDACLKEFGEIRVLPYSETFLKSYQYSAHCTFVEYNVLGDTVKYIKDVLSSTTLLPGMRLFIPGDKKRSSHYEICNLLLKKNVIVCLFFFFSRVTWRVLWIMRIVFADMTPHEECFLPLFSFPLFAMRPFSVHRFIFSFSLLY
jgi:hypothetical protein